MTSQQMTPTEERVHPVHRFSGRLSAVLDGLADSSMWSMTPDEQAETLVELTTAVGRLAELRFAGAGIGGPQ